MRRQLGGHGWPGVGVRRGHIARCGSSQTRGQDIGQMESQTDGGQ